MGKKIDDTICRRSLEIARAMNDERVTDRKRHYAFIWRGTNLISLAQNETYRDPLMDYWGYPPESMAHAEFVAIRRLNQIDCRKFTMITFRLTKTGMLTNGKPCKYCDAVIRHFGFQKIWFSTEDRHLEEIFI